MSKIANKKEVTDKTKLNRLNKLLTYLRKLDREEPERFNLNTWIGNNPHNKSAFAAGWKDAIIEWRERYKNGEPLNCGTTACVVGHLPVVFPGSWKWTESGNIIHTIACPMSKVKSKEDNLADFFGGTSVFWYNTIYSNNQTYGEDLQNNNGKVKLTSVIKRIEVLRDYLKK